MGGTWSVLTVTKEGEIVPGGDLKNTSIVFDRQQYRVTQGKEVVSQGDLELDDKSNSKRIKNKPKRGANKGETLAAFYEINKNRLRLCVAPTGADYPKEFVSTDKNKCSLYVFEKK